MMQFMRKPSTAPDTAVKTEGPDSSLRSLLSKGPQIVGRKHKLTVSLTPGALAKLDNWARQNRRSRNEAVEEAVHALCTED